MEIGGNINVRGDIAMTARLADCMLKDGDSTYINPKFGYSNSTLTAQEIESKIISEQGVLIQLFLNTAPSDVSQSRYILITGVNTETNQVEIIDPTLQSPQRGVWVSFNNILPGYTYSKTITDL